MSDLVDAFIEQIGLILPYVGAAIGAVIGLTALVALGRFIVSRVRGSIK